MPSGLVNKYSNVKLRGQRANDIICDEFMEWPNIDTIESGTLINASKRKLIFPEKSQENA